MKNTIWKASAFLLTAAVSWLLLSFYFFPIEAGTEAMGAQSFFWASVTHMAAIKLIITLIFSVFAVFVTELHTEKRKKKKAKK